MRMVWTERLACWTLRGGRGVVRVWSTGRWSTRMDRVLTDSPARTALPRVLGVLGVRQVVVEGHHQVGPGHIEHLLIALRRDSMEAGHNTRGIKRNLSHDVVWGRRDVRRGEDQWSTFATAHEGGAQGGSVAERRVIAGSAGLTRLLETGHVNGLELEPTSVNAWAS